MIGPFETNSLHCVNSYEAIKLIPDKSIDCIYTDIPYLYVKGGKGHSELGDRAAKKRSELKEIQDGIDYSIFHEFCRALKKINVFIWCSRLQLLDIMKFFIDEKECLFELLTWNKTNPTPTTNNAWLPDIEYCLYFREKGVPLNDGYELKSKWFVSGANTADKEKFEHPTIKPLPLVTRHLQHVCGGGAVVFDPFAGSGTTCVAAKNLGLNYLGFEIDPKWAKIAQDRLNNISSGGQISLFTI